MTPGHSDYDSDVENCWVKRPLTTDDDSLLLTSVLLQADGAGEGAVIGLHLDLVGAVKTSEVAGGICLVVDFAFAVPFLVNQIGKAPVDGLGSEVIIVVQQSAFVDVFVPLRSSGIDIRGVVNEIPVDDAGGCWMTEPNLVEPFCHVCLEFEAFVT